MKKVILVAGMAMYGFAVNIPADVIDLWSFTYANGTLVGSALSEQGSDWGADNGVNAVVQNQRLEFAYDGSIASTFRNATPSGGFSGATTGKYELSWTVTSADFSLTHANSSTNLGRVGFGIRTLPANLDANVRLIGINNELRLDYSDSVANSSVFQTFSGSTIQNLQLRLVYDLDNRGNAGSFQVFYTPDGGSEVAAVTSGTLHSGFELDAVRMIQQTSNGGTSWMPGDTVVVDNVTLSVVPEPSTLAFLGVSATLLYFSRRRFTV